MFNKKPQQSARPSASPRTMAGSTFSVLGSDVTCTSLVQGETSEIVGAIKAETARLSGTVRGTISARDLVVLKSARIHGDVHYDALTIEQGAQVDGRFAPRSTALGETEPEPALLTGS